MPPPVRVIRTEQDMIASADRIGNYRLEHELAREPAVVVFRATHLVLPRRAVVKVLREAASAHAIQTLREACLLAALHHPGVVRVFESGLLPDHRPWFAMEHVTGSPVASVLSPGALDRVDAVALLRDLAEILDHAHHRGVVACGLRPDRVLLTSRRGRGFPLCVVDWSDARAHDAKPAPFVVPPSGYAYASPELVAGDPVDDRTDVYSLGVLAYELLTGVLPFATEVATAADGSKQHVPTEVRCADAPRELTHLVDTMLAYDRWDRPSITEVLTELAWLADALPMTASLQAPIRIRRPRWTPALQPSNLAARDAVPAPPTGGPKRRDPAQ